MRGLIALTTSLLALSTFASDGLQFDGWQRVDTGYCPVAGDRFECEVTVESDQPRSTAAVFGTVPPQNPERAFAFYVRQNCDDSTVVAYGGTARGGFFPRGKKVTLSVGPDGATWTWDGGSSRLELTPGLAMDGVTPLMIGDVNVSSRADKDGPAGTGTAMTLHRFRVWRGGQELIHDYEPEGNGLRDNCGRKFLQIDPEGGVTKRTVTVEDGIPNVLSVDLYDQNGRITGKREGNTTVYTVREGDDISAYYEVESNYVSLVENPIRYPEIRNNVKIDADFLRTVRRLEENIPYRMWDAKKSAMIECVCSNAFPITADTQALADGQWYAVTETVSCGSIKVGGSAHLILCDGATLTADAITNGTLTIYGQPSGCGALEVSGAVASVLTVQGGRISAGTLSGDSVAVVGGTLVADAVRNDTVKIAGGSVKTKACESQPTNMARAPLYCVTVVCPGMSEERGAGSEEGRGLRLEGLGGYGTNDIFAVKNDEGVDCVYLWLPNGTYQFAVSDGETTYRYRAVVNGKAITVELLGRVGFRVNYVDVAYGKGPGWSYTNGVLSLTNAMTYVLSGTATNNEVQVQAMTDAARVVLSNAVIFASGRQAIKVAQKTNLTVVANQLLKTGTTPETLRYAQAYNDESCVLVGPGVAVTVKAISHVTDFTVSNAVEVITNVTGGATCRVMAGDDVYVGYAVEKGYFSDVANPLVWRSIKDGIVVDANMIVIYPSTLSYRAWNATERRMEDLVCTNYTVVKADTATFENGKWYAVMRTVNCGTIMVNGSAHLILCDDTTLTADGASDHAGIEVGKDHALTIYAQALGTGKVVAKGGTNGAGIGGGNGGAGGTVTINGGAVAATGGRAAAGIGGGDRGAGGKVTINGGTVTATGGEDAAVDIGKGRDNNNEGTLTIDGGSIKAARVAKDLAKNSTPTNVYCVTVMCPGMSGERGGLRVEGLGEYGTNDIFAINGYVYLWLTNGMHRFTVSDGETTYRYREVVNGEDVMVKPLPTYGFLVNGVDVGDGFNTGWSYTNGVLSLTNAMTYVLSGVATNNEMQVRATTDAAKVVLSNMVVFATERPALVVAQSNLTVVANQLLKTGTAPETLRYAQAYNDERCVLVGPAVTVTVKAIPHVTGFTVSNAVETITNVTGSATCRVVAGDDVYVGYAVERGYFSQSANPLVYGPVVSNIVVDANTIGILPNIPYRAWNEATRRMEDRFCTNYTVVEADMTTFEDGRWYAVTGTVSRGTITVNGSAHLILCDGARLTATGDGNDASIAVEAGNALAIYAQALGTGELVAKAKAVNDGERGAGIGGASRKPGGTITIDGGWVTAEGGFNGAGIGGGCFAAGGSVTINGGYVTTQGHGAGAGIGNGWKGGLGETRINGGTVVARAGETWNNHPFGNATRIDGGSVMAANYDGNPAVTNRNAEKVYCVTVKLSEEGGAGGEEGRGLRLEGLGGYGTNDIFAINECVYLWLTNGTHWFSVSDGDTTYGYRAVVRGAAITVEPGVPVMPGRTTGPFATAGEATNAMKIAVIRPRDDVAAVLGTETLWKTYCNMFGFAVTGGGVDWFVEAVLTPTAQTNLYATVTNVTQQLPVAAIARLPSGVTTNVTVQGCEPGFFYSLYDGWALTNIVADANTTNLNVLCGASAKVVFPEVKKPSEKTGFFRVGVGVTDDVGK